MIQYFYNFLYFNLAHFFVTVTRVFYCNTPIFNEKWSYFQMHIFQKVSKVQELGQQHVIKEGSYNYFVILNRWDLLE